MRTSKVAAVAPFIGAVLLVGTLAVAVTVPVVAQDACTDGIVQVDEAVTAAVVLESDMVAVKSLLDVARASRDGGDMRACTATLTEARAILERG